MNRKELVASIVGHTGQDKKTVEAVLGGFVDATLASVARNLIMARLLQTARRALKAA